MAYTTASLSSVNDCDTLLAMAEKEKSSLEFRKTSLEFRQSAFVDNSKLIDAELTSVDIELTAKEAQIAGMPEGPDKEKAITDKMELEVRKRKLLERKANYGSMAVLDKEFDIARTNLEITEVDNYMAAISSRKVELQQAA